MTIAYTRQELEAIRKSSGEKSVDIAKAHDIERKIKHDLMAELRVFADQAKEGGGKLHLGATSMDIGAAQEVFGKVGRLDRIDIVLPPGMSDADRGLFEEEVRASLPPGLTAGIDL